MPRRPFYPSSAADLPEWVRGLPNIERVLDQWKSSAPERSAGRGWEVSVSFPDDVYSAVEAGALDPAVLLVGLRYAAGRLEDKTSELVALCRDSGHSWTRIGEILGVSKQAAWERYSDEE